MLKLTTIRFTEAEKRRFKEFCAFVNIDRQSGFGYKGESPLPWLTNTKINNNYKFRNRTNNLVQTPFVHAFRNLNPAFYYSLLSYNADQNIPCGLSLNNDLDDHYYENGKKIKTDPITFAQNSKIVRDKWFPKAYSRPSTNGKGSHNHTMLDVLRRDFVNAEGKYITEDNASEIVREKLLQFQKLLREWIQLKNLKVHYDVLGAPCIYDNDGYILDTKERGGRGSWNKVPDNLMDDKNWNEFKSQERWTWKEFLLKIELLEKEIADMKVGESEEQRKVRIKNQSHGSNSVNVNLENMDGLVFKLDEVFFQGERIDIGDRHYANAKKVAICYRIMMACAEKNSKKSGEYKDTCPMELVKTIHKSLYEKHIIDFGFDASLYAWLKTVLYPLGLISVPENTEAGFYIVGEFDANGEKTGGIAQKYIITKELEEAFLSEDPLAVLLPQNNRVWVSHNQFSHFYLVSSVKMEAILEEDVPIWAQFCA